MLFHPVAVEKANPQYAALLQEQLGGANGELKAAMQYMLSLIHIFFINSWEKMTLPLGIAALRGFMGSGNLSAVMEIGRASCRERV